MSAQTIALELIDSEGWVKHAGHDEVRGIVYVKSTQDYGKVYKLVAEVEVNAATYYRDIVEKHEDVPRWNSSLLKQEILEVVDDSTDVSYTIAAKAAGGLVSSR